MDPFTSWGIVILATLAAASGAYAIHLIARADREEARRDRLDLLTNLRARDEWVDEEWPG